MKTREAWLERAVELEAALFAEMEWKVPKKIKVSCGWPSVGALSKKKQRIGECWSSENSRSGHFEIFISPKLDDELRVLDVLAHELVHATVGLKCGHRGQFKRCAIEIGLTGPMRSTIASDDLKKRLNALSKMLGSYPHKEILHMTNGRKKQSTRLRKIVCPDCGWTARASAKWIDAGLPTCQCGGEIVCADEGDDASDGE
jgi:hypothetical protein